MHSDDNEVEQMKSLPHRRLNILTGKWVLVSAHRSNRPWQGQEEEVESYDNKEFDATCYLCPGNTRVSGNQNEDYTGAFSFENDHPALMRIENPVEYSEDGLLVAKSESGCCKVICFTPKHNLTLAEMSVGEIQAVIELWKQEYLELSECEDINYVQIFENKGAVMGCSNPHPHGQIWAQESIPDEPAEELVQMKNYFSKPGNEPLLIDYLNLEIQSQTRVVCENQYFLVVVPFWATWPFETLVIPKKHITHVAQLNAEQTLAYAEIIKEITVRYDNLFETSFPYSAGLHQAPVDGSEYPECTFHMHFYPPLLRSATIKKFMVGYEMLGGAQRDITPEMSAQLLRNTSNQHYKESSQQAK